MDTLHPLRQWRKDHDKTLEDLATDLRVTSSYLSMIECGIKQPSLPLSAKLYRLTGIPMERFVREERV